MKSFILLIDIFLIITLLDLIEVIKEHDNQVNIVEI